MTAMMGRQVKLNHRKRCDWQHCHIGPVKLGYTVNSEDLEGFFCGAKHAQSAYDFMQENKKKL